MIAGSGLRLSLLTGLALGASFVAAPYAFAFEGLGSLAQVSAVSAAYSAPYSAPSGVVRVAASNAQLEEARDFVESLVDRALGFLSNPSLTHEQRQAEFKALLRSRFDTQKIARFSLGTYWRNASAAEQKEYLRLFDAMLVDVYSQRFGDYKGQRVEIGSARPEGKKDIVVSSRMINADGPDVTVEWRVRYSNGGYRVIDVIVEGVSMALTQRSDFSSVIQRGGGDVEVLLAYLRGE